MSGRLSPGLRGQLPCVFHSPGRGRLNQKGIALRRMDQQDSWSHRVWGSENASIDFWWRTSRCTASLVPKPSRWEMGWGGGGGH